MRFTDDLKARVSKAQKRIVLPETNSRRVLKAAERVLADGFAKIILIGSEEQIHKDAENSKSHWKVLKLSILQHMAVWTNYVLILQKT